MDVRANIAAAKRVIVKIGSSSLTNSDHRVDVSKVDRLVDAIAARCARGSDVIVVSSGALAAGVGGRSAPHGWACDSGRFSP